MLLVRCEGILILFVKHILDSVCVLTFLEYVLLFFLLLRLQPLLIGRVGICRGCWFNDGARATCAYSELALLAGMAHLT